MIPNRNYTHTVFLEVASSQNCIPCHNWSQKIYDSYNSGNYDFYYVEMIVFDHNGNVLNERALDWDKKYKIGSYPTSICDGDYKRIVGNYPELLPDTLNDCGNRTVQDIIAGITLTWLGDATIQIDISIENNKDIQYNGHIRACITEIISRYDTYYGNPYHFGFLDYAFDEDISINSWDVYYNSTIWNGNEHADSHGEDFGDIIPYNIQVTMGVINEDNGYVDETVMARINGNNPPNKPDSPSPSDREIDVDIAADLSWSCSDPDGGPLKYDVYFGLTNPPIQVVWNQSSTEYDPGVMNYKTTYYWRIVAWDNYGVSTSGPIWDFTTAKRDNIPPNVKIIKPQRALYIKNNNFLPRFLRLPLIIGKITIEVNATDEDSGVEKVEFYINGKLKGNDTTEPYTYEGRRDHLRIVHIYVIKIKVYDWE